MSIHKGPLPIVTSNLILAFDALNYQSYPGSGDTWYDVSKTSDSGSLINGPVFSTEGKKSISFDGTNEYVNINYSGVFSTTSYTIMFWAKSNVLSSLKTFVGFSDSSAPSGPQAYYCHNIQQWVGDPNEILSFVSSGTGYQYYRFTPDVSLTDWNFYCEVITPSNIKTYVNDIVYYDSSSITVRNNFDKIWLGTRNAPSEQNLNGYMANFFLYERGLTNEEILQNYNALKPRFRS